MLWSSRNTAVKVLSRYGRNDCCMRLQNRNSLSSATRRFRLLETINEDREFHAWVWCVIWEMEDYCIRHADKVTSPSRSLAEYFQKRVGREDIAICPYPLYLDFAEHPLPIIERELKTVRFFRSVQVRKGVDTFIRARFVYWNRIRNFDSNLWGRSETRFSSIVLIRRSCRT